MVDRERQLVAVRAAPLVVGGLQAGVEDEDVDAGIAEQPCHRGGELADTVERGEIERYDLGAARHRRSASAGADDDARVGLSGDLPQRMCAEPGCDAGHDDNTLSVHPEDGA
jgi:hypothetical protein